MVVDGICCDPGELAHVEYVTSQYPATAVVLLARDGVLSLEDDISKWIPEVKGFGKKISVRHLLTHTSGLPDRYTLHEVQNRPAG